MMKKAITILSIFILSISIYGQKSNTSRKFIYKSVVKDLNDKLLTNATVKIKVDILKGSNPTAAVIVYEEVQTATTNKDGLLTIEIGNNKDATVTFGQIKNIQWETDVFFIKTETDLQNDGSYDVTSTRQLMGKSRRKPSSVKTVDSTTKSSKPYHLGQEVLGGIVFYISKDSKGEQHGLIVSQNEKAVVWQSSSIETNATSPYNGKSNTRKMKNNLSAVANYVTSLRDGGYKDWYLPSVDELSLLWKNRFYVNKSLNDTSSPLLSGSYWSSTECTTSSAFYVYLDSGFSSYINKGTLLGVRAIRAF